MKRLHVLSITFLAGLIMGAAIPAKAAESYNGSYVCGNTGYSVQIQFTGESKMVQGRISYPVQYSITDESGKVLEGGYQDVVSGQGIFIYPSQNYAFLLSDYPSIEIVKVIKSKLKDKIIKTESFLICSK